MEDFFEIHTPLKVSNWECEVFGVKYRPSVGKVPNWFHRNMQRLFFGAKWRKVSK